MAGSKSTSPSSPRSTQRRGGGFARHRKIINENLGTIVALIAAAFAGWSAWEAEKGREDAHTDAMYSLKVAQRSYIQAETNTISGEMLLGTPTLYAHYNVKVYGSSPAFNIQVLANCKLGPAGYVLNKPEGITKADYQNISPLQLPTMVVGNEIPLQTHCQSPDRKDDIIGVTEFGEIDYKDVFGDSHFTHFCYYHPTLIHAAVASGDEKKYRKWAIEAGKHIIPCDIYNDAD